MCITALGVGLALGACDRGKPKAEREAERGAEPAQAEPPVPTEPAKVDEVVPGEAPQAPAEDPAPPAMDAGAPPSGDNGSGAKEQPADTGGAKGACGGVGGLRCKKSQKCRYAAGASAPPHPDAMGKCVDETYCDAPPDCASLMHVMTLGEWACQKHRCVWKSKGGSGPM